MSEVSMDGVTGRWTFWQFVWTRRSLFLSMPISGKNTPSDSNRQFADVFSMKGHLPVSRSCWFSLECYFLNKVVLVWILPWLLKRSGIKIQQLSPLPKALAAEVQCTDCASWRETTHRCYEAIHFAGWALKTDASDLHKTIMLRVDNAFVRRCWKFIQHCCGSSLKVDFEKGESFISVVFEEGLSIHTSKPYCREPSSTTLQNWSHLLALVPGEFVFSRHVASYFFSISSLFGMSFP